MPSVTEPAANGHSTAASLWRSLFVSTAACAYDKRPESASRIDKAVSLILRGAMTLDEATGLAVVKSLEAKGDVEYTVSSGGCTCKDFTEGQAPDGWCKHRIARTLSLRTMEAAKAYQVPEVPEAPASGVAPQYLTSIHGKTFVQYAGLRMLAGQRGLTSLEVSPITVTPDLAVFAATARFDNGQVWVEIGDATPTNVASHIKPHYIRMAATRAKARVLREALHVSLVAVEELAE
jgi:hypothetical protein